MGSAEVYSPAVVDVIHRDAEKRHRGSTGFKPGKLAGTIRPATTETNGANDVESGRTSFHTKCFHSGEETTKVMYPWSMRAVAERAAC